MKILCICQYYFPEPFRISDICEELVKQGHEVTVVTGIPNYPMGKIYPEYRGKQLRNEKLNGVNIHRCFTIGRRHGPIWRFLNYYSYMFSSTRYVSKLKEEFDVVFVNQLSPVMMANAGIKYKKKHGTKLVLYCLDLWPESLVAGGVRRGSLLYRLFHRASSRIYSMADKILISSQSFSKYFKDEFGIEATEYLPQYAEQVFNPEICKKKPNEFIDLMFAGNIGAAQSVDTIIEAANLTRDIPNLRWHIVGDGSDLDRVKKLSESYNLNSVIFYGRKSLDEMPKYYSMADAMLVTMQKDPTLSMTLPGKIQTYMAAGKPIIGAIDGEAAEVIDEADCGYCVSAEDAYSLSDACREFSCKSNVVLLSQNAENFYRYAFSKTNFFDSLQNTISKRGDFL